MNRAQCQYGAECHIHSINLELILLINFQFYLSKEKIIVKMKQKPTFFMGKIEN
jgi:hypothetical protein